MAALTLLGVGLAFGYGWGYLARERQNQREWRDYQAFLEEQRKGWDGRSRRRAAQLTELDTHNLMQEAR